MNDAAELWRAKVHGGGISPREMRGTLTLIRDPELWAVIAIVVAAVIMLPNPLDQEGAIDAFIYNGYSLNFSNLINRYGPWYFSYRISHLFWLWLARVVVGYDHSQKALAIGYLSTIAASSWIILRPYLPRLGAAGLIVLMVLSPWTIKTVATSYLDATCVTYMFVLTALLLLNKRAGHADRRLSFAAGCVLGLIVNANTYLLVFGCLIFLAHFAVPLERRTILTLSRSGLIAVLGFFAATVILWLTWTAILVIGSGTPISAVLRWTGISLHGTAWDSDMFSVAVGTAMAKILTTDPRPYFWHMFREGQVHVVFPVVVMTSTVLYRLWAVPRWNTAKAGEWRKLREEWDAVALSAVLIVGYCYVTSESMGNQMLSAPFYFVYMLPVVYLSAALTVSYAWHADAHRRLASAVVVAALLAIAVYAAAALVPSATFSILIRPGVGTKIAWMLAALAVIAPLPLWRPVRGGALILALLVLGGPLFLASSSGYYRIPYSADMEFVSRDVLNAQRALISFVERTAPPPGVSPNGHPVIFWYPNTEFMVSLSGTYLADYEALDWGHGHAGLPQLDERGIAQLRAGNRREIVLVTDTAAEWRAAEKALHDLGVGFDVIANEAFTGAKRSALFTYIRVTKPPT
jgi:hypothetical protein